MPMERDESAISRWHEKHRFKARGKDKKAYPYLGGYHDRKINKTMLMYAVATLFCVAYLYHFITTTGQPDPDDLSISEQLAATRAAALTPTATAAATENDYALLVQRSASNPLDTLPTLPPIIINSDLIDLLPTATPSPEPTFTPIPTLTPTPTPIPDLIWWFRVGFWHPPLGGSHCPNGERSCNDLEINRRHWLFWDGKGVAACPKQFEGLQITIAETLYTCVYALEWLTCDYFMTTCDIAVLSRPDEQFQNWHEPQQGFVWN